MPLAAPGSTQQHTFYRFVSACHLASYDFKMMAITLHSKPLCVDYKITAAGKKLPLLFISDTTISVATF
jgi:hypothetical protein